MLNIKKALNQKIISILLTAVFFFNSFAYGIDLTQKSSLRVPVLSDSEKSIARFRATLGIAESTKTEDDSSFEPREDLTWKPSPVEESVYACWQALVAGNKEKMKQLLKKLIRSNPALVKYRFAENLR